MGLILNACLNSRGFVGFFFFFCSYWRVLICLCYKIANAVGFRRQWRCFFYNFLGSDIGKTSLEGEGIYLNNYSDSSKVVSLF